MGINNDFTNLQSFLPQPGVTEGEKTETASPKDAAAKVARDINTHTDTYAKATDRLEISLSFPENPKIPVPSLRLEVKMAGKDNPQGAGNPFLAPIPFVQVQAMMLELYETMRQSNLGMAAYENVTMSLNIEFAKTAAELIMTAAKAEANMAICEAVIAGAGMVGSAVGLGMSAKAQFRSDQGTAAAKAKAEFETAKSYEQNLAKPNNEAKANLEVSQKRFEYQQAIENNSPNIETKKIELQNAEKAYQDLTGRPPVPLRPSETVAGAPQSKIDRYKADFDAKQKTFDTSNKKFKEAEADTKNMKEKYKQAEREHGEYINQQTQLGSLISTFITQMTTTVAKSVSTHFIIEKGQAQALQQVVDALRENIKQSGQAASQTQQQTKDVMNSIIQAIKELNDQHVQASTMTRG